MNKCNDWENLLRISNEDLEKSGYSLRIVGDGEGYYSCEIWKDGKFIVIYAENYWEDELSDLIIEAFHYIVDTYILNRYIVDTYIPKKEENGTGIVVRRKNITPEDIKRSKQVLIDNGIEEDEVDVVLQAIGYTLIDTELYP